MAGHGPDIELGISGLRGTETSLMPMKPSKYSQFQIQDKLSGSKQ